MRIAWLDTARGLGILLVMIGHSRALPAILEQWIFVFHMPLFFLLAGVTFASKREQPLAAVLRSRARALLVPFAFFWVASYLFWLVAHTLRPEEHSIGLLEPLSGLFFAAGSTLLVNAPLWFLSCLFVTTVLWHVLLRAGERVAWLLAVGISALGMLGLRRFAPALAWNVDVACVVLPFFALGELLGRTRALPVSRGWSLALVLSGFALTWAALQLNVQVDLHQRIVGNPFWFVAGALGGIAMMLGLSSVVPVVRPLHVVGRESLTLFATHIIVYAVITGIGVIAFHLPRTFKDSSPWLVLVDVAVATAVGLLVAALLRRYLPAAVGRATETSR